jgi:hypothetical protein
MEQGDEDSSPLVPELMAYNLVPKIPGLDTSQFQDWHWIDANKQKAVHFLWDKKDVKRVQALIQITKDNKLVEMSYSTDPGIFPLYLVICLYLSTYSLISSEHARVSTYEEGSQLQV